MRRGRENLFEELGRVEAEPSNRNRRAEISRVHGELNKGYAKGGKAGTGPSPGTRIKARKARAHEWWTGHTGTQGIYSPTIDKKLREKRPHSSPEGRMRDVKKIMAEAGERRKIRPKIPKHGWKSTPTFKRAKHGIGSLVKKIITKIKPKPKPGKGLGSGIKPSEVKDILKSPGKSWGKTRAEYLREYAPYFGGRSMKKEMKAYPKGVHARNKESKKVFKSAKGKAGGGRIGLKHGTSPQQHYLQHGYGPTKAKLRAGKPKIAKKGWA